MTATKTCLQCGETKASLRAGNITACGIEGGYEYREIIEEWANHRWADWNDTELARAGVRPEAYDRHRRTPLMDFQWIACDDTIRGHVLAKPEDVPFLAVKVGQCILCGLADARLLIAR